MFLKSNIPFVSDLSDKQTVKFIEQASAPSPEAGKLIVWSNQGKLYGIDEFGHITNYSSDSSGSSGTNTTTVADITARDAIQESSRGLVYVTDASADPTVTSGAAFYIYSNSQWKKISESESLDFNLSNLFNFQTQNTDDISEGNNKFISQAQKDAINQNTHDLANLNLSDNFKKSVDSTDDITESSSKKFLTPAERIKISQFSTSSSSSGSGSLNSIDKYDFSSSFINSVNINWDDFDVSNYVELRLMIDFFYTGNAASGFNVRGIIDNQVNSQSIYDYNVFNFYQSTNTTSENNSSADFGRIIDDSNGMYADENNKYQVILNITGFGNSEFTKINARSIYKGSSSWGKSEAHVVIKSTEIINGLSLYASGGQIKGNAHLHGYMSTERTPVYIIQKAKQMPKIQKAKQMPSVA